MAGLAKAGLVIGLVSVVLLVTAGSVWLLRDDYQVLFADLNPQDASAMVTELDRMKVPYRLADNGNSILVEREAVYKTRLKLMGKGLDLHGAVGLEIFSNTDFGMTEFAQKVNYLRALQGELARTIMGFEEIKQARVHLVLPESGLFKRANAKPKASISLTVRNGARLTPEQVSGIQRLVAASVPEIDAASVTLLDQHGVALSKESEDGGTGTAPNGRLETKRQIEDYLARKVVSVLDRAVGPGRAIVSVDAQLNFDQVRVTQENVVPLPNTAGQNVGAITRRRDSTQGGDPVTDAIASASGQKTTAGSGITSSSEVEFTNGKRVEQIVSEPGGIRRISVGVMVPDISDPVELAKLKEVVSMAVGVNAARGDAIVVYSRGPVASPQEGAGNATVVSGENSSTEAPSDMLPRQPSAARSVEPVLLILIGLAGLIGLVGIVWWVKRSEQPRSLLSEDERDQLLTDLKQWAAGGKSL